jgi:hypothetical protein
MKQSHISIILLSFLFASCAGAPAHANAQSGEPDFAVTTKNQDDQAIIQFEDNTALIDIHSPTGIGSAAFELQSGNMPENIVLRLHLQGLEDFRLLSGNDQIAASLSSSDPLSGDQRIISSESESPLLRGHPLWMEIEIVSEGEKDIPLKQGHFEVTIPQEFIQNAGNSFEIQWIDFYR